MEEYRTGRTDITCDEGSQAQEYLWLESGQN